MLGLTFATIWRRRTQTLLLLLLAVIAAAAAAAAPGYVVASEQSLAVASAADATAADRVVEARVDRPVSPDLGADLAAFTGRVRDTLGLPGRTAIAGASMVAVVTGADPDARLPRRRLRAPAPSTARVRGRPGRCCWPDQRSPTSWACASATRSAVRGRTEIPPVPMTVVGRYRAAEPRRPVLGPPGRRRPSRSPRSASSPRLATFALLGANRAALSVDLVVTPAGLPGGRPGRRWPSASTTARCG